VQRKVEPQGEPNIGSGSPVPADVLVLSDVDSLPDNARRALERARAERLSYSVRIVRSPGGRLVAILGEAHLKLEKASAIGKEVVGAFELRGVETFQRKQVIGGRALGVVISAPRNLLRALSLGAIKGSTITDAKQLPSGHTVELERAKRMPVGLHVASLYMTAFFVVSFLALLAPLLWGIAPLLAGLITFVAFAFQVHMLALVPGILLRRHSWSWLIHPFLGILTPRDHLMAAGTVRMLEDHPREGAAVLVMGRAHVSGVERLLVDKYGFTPVP
jgi:hypothetical protein